MKKTYPVLTFLLMSFSCFAQTVNFESSNLPIFIINTKGQTIVDDPKITANLKIIYNGAGQMNRLTDKNYHYNNNIGIEIRGNSSQMYPQQQYGFETRDSSTNKNLDFPLLDMPADNDWVLYAPYNDVSMLRNVLTYNLFNQMGHWASRTKFCEVVINGDYKGIYILVESIKRGGKRVDVAKIGTKDTTGLDVTGGYIMKIDKKNSDSDMSFISKFKSSNNQNVEWLYHYPKAKDIHPKQAEYIHSYIDSVETAIHSSNFADLQNGYARYISVQSFIDYLILTELSNNIDAYKASTYFYKEKKADDGTKGKLKAGPVWDYNFAFGNASFCQGAGYTGWMYKGCNPATLPTPTFWERLLEDPAFKNKVKCRYESLRQGILSNASINTFLEKYAFDTLAQAQVRHFNRWKILGTNPGYFNAYIVNSYNEEIQKVKTWISNRLSWMDANIEGICPIVAGLNMNQSSNEETIKLYPNPFTDVVSLSSSSILYTLHLYDAQGKLVFTKDGINANETTLDSEMHNLPPGLYVIRCITGTGPLSKWLHKSR